MISPDGDNKYPGELKLFATYTLLNNGNGATTLNLDMGADFTGNCDKSCPINLTNHSYFNLGGHERPEGILSHNLQINAFGYTPTDADSIPTH